MIKWFFVVALALSACSRSVPATFHVALTGNNSSDGTAAAPWRTLRYAVAQLRAGDHLCIGAGTWTGGEDVIDSQTATVPSGTDLVAGAVTIGGCNRDIVVLKPPAGLTAIRLTTGAPHHLVFEHLTLDGSLQPDPPCCHPDTGVITDAPELLYTSNGAHHLRFDQLVIEHAMSHAVQLSSNNADPATPTYLEFRNSTFRDIGNATGDSGHGGPGVNNGYAIYSFTSGATITGNLFTDTRGIALVVYGPNNIISGNHFTKSGTRGGPAYAVNIGSSSHPIPSTGNRFVNNIVDDNAQGGLQVYTNATADIVHNTFIRNGTWALHAQYCQPGVTVVNNLFHANTVDAVNDSPATCTVLGDHNQPSSVEPRLVNEAGHDYHLAVGSPAVDAGRTLSTVAFDKDGVARPLGAASDIGAYELATSTPPPTTTKYRVTTDIELHQDGTLTLTGSGAPVSP